MNKIANLTLKMIKYNCGDKRRIAHAIKVHDYSQTIGKLENLSKRDQLILESGAILHDIGIKVCEEKYGACGGKLQEKEGPHVALPILKELEYEKEDIDKILYLIANHHSYNNITTDVHQILIEADFLVNLEEENTSKKAILKVYNKIFKTETGRRICKNLFNLD